MPLAERSLRHLVNEREGRLEPSEALEVVRDIATALADLDGRVVHRDLKPENVLLLADRWCLCDFGIARYADATTAPDTRLECCRSISDLDVQMQPVFDNLGLGDRLETDPWPDTVWGRRWSPRHRPPSLPARPQAPRESGSTPSRCVTCGRRFKHVAKRTSPEGGLLDRVGTVDDKLKTRAHPSNLT